MHAAPAYFGKDLGRLVMDDTTLDQYVTSNRFAVHFQLLLSIVDKND